MNKITLALGAVIAIAATLALTTALERRILRVPLGSHTPCPNKANSTASNSSSGTASNSSSGTASNSSHIVKSDLLFGVNSVVSIASNNPTLEPISSYHQCIGHGCVSSDPNAC